jgi:chromosome segregation ATPase
MSNDLRELSRRVRAARHTLERQAGVAKEVFQRGADLQAEVTALSAEVERYTRAAAILNKIGEEQQASAQEQIETLVTKGLSTIFGEGTSFHLVSTERARRQEVDLVIRSRRGDIDIETGVLDSDGGGLAAIVGALLRIVILLLSRDRQQPVLILDEPFVHLSENHHAVFARFLREIADKAGVQIIMVTHQEKLAEHADKVYRFVLTDGATRVTAV